MVSRNALHSLIAAQGLNLFAAAPADPAAPVGAIPTAPGPNDVFKAGGNCTFSWTPDTSGTWKETNVQLMTGDNFQMIHLTTVYQFDGTQKSPTTYSYPCPDVTPHSAIYFYQFTSPAATDKYWTTRWAISDEAGKLTPPENAKQPGDNGAAIPWGTGALVNPSTAKPPPAYLATPGPTTNTTTPPKDTDTSTSTNTTTPTDSKPDTTNSTTTPDKPKDNSKPNDVTTTTTTVDGKPTTPVPGSAMGLSAGWIQGAIGLASAALALTLVV